MMHIHFLVMKGGCIKISAIKNDFFSDNFTLLSYYYISITDCKKDKTKCECGIPLPASKKTQNNARIFNGQDATPLQFPWQVFLEIKAKINGSTVFGGAVLVSKKHILATAHAFHDHEFPFSR